MTKHVSLSDDVHALLRSVAYNNGRSIAGQIKYMLMRDQDDSTPPLHGEIVYDKQNNDDEFMRLKRRLDEVVKNGDEDSDEYYDIVDRIRELQEKK